MDAFYLKYRPKTISELDCASAREMLTSNLKSKDMPHAFLFSGPKGTGKTSSARILAKTLGCLNPKGIDSCNKCDVCLATEKGVNLDIIEIDAASNRGIDDIRQLREKVGLSPLRARNKIYIIDEVHMLTNEAFNAILKTLEEPPEHVYFIFCTTNPEKVPETVISRLTSVVFQKANKDEVKRCLARAVEGEDIEIEENSLDLIASISQGSFRDAHKLLYQLFVSEGKKITHKKAENLLGRWIKLSPEKMVEMIIKGETKSALKLTKELENEGADWHEYLRGMMEYVQKLIIAKTGASKPEETDIDILAISDLNSLTALSLGLAHTVNLLREAIIPSLPLQILICDSVFSKGDSSGPEADKALDSTPKIANYQTKRIKKKSLSGSKAIDLETDSEVNSEASLGLGDTAQLKDFIDKWPEILQAVKPMNHSVEALLRACRPTELNEGRITIEVFYPFHKQKLEEERNRRIIEDGIKKVLGFPWKVFCTLAQKDSKSKPPKDDLYEQAKEIFGK